MKIETFADRIRSIAGKAISFIASELVPIQEQFGEAGYPITIKVVRRSTVLSSEGLEFERLMDRDGYRAHIWLDVEIEFKGETP